MLKEVGDWRTILRENILIPEAVSTLCLPHFTLCSQKFSEISVVLVAALGLLGLSNLCPSVLPEHTTDLGFPRSALLSSSCQYTMVPLGGLPGHQANGQPYLSGTSRRACASGIHMNRGCPAAAMGYPGVKPQQHCPGVPQQVTSSWEWGHVGAGQRRGVVGLPPGAFPFPPLILGYWVWLSLVRNSSFCGTPNRKVAWTLV